MAKAKTNTKKVDFSIIAPDAQSVALVADFTQWDQNPIPLKKQKNGHWKLTHSLAPGSYQYRFLVDGQWTDDPLSTTRVPNPYGGENNLLLVE